MGVYPALPNKTMTISGVKVELPNDFYRDYCIMFGNRAREILEAAIDHDLEPEIAVDVYGGILNSWRSKALAIAKSEYKEQYGEPEQE